jgi:ribosomal protein S18 acetylase RimI-like enzyme
MEIKTLENIPLSVLHAARNDAFSDYPRSWANAAYEKMLRRRGYEASLSFGAFEGDLLASLTLNGIGELQGKKTAYDTGTGTRKAYRGLGLAGKIFDAVVPLLKQHGIKTYLLEVLQDNAAAIKIYKNAGFTITRGLNYFFQQPDEIRLPQRELDKKYTIVNVGPDNVTMRSMWDFEPSWQNSFAAIGRNQADFTTIAVMHGDKTVGYGIIEPATGDIPQLAVAHAHRGNGIASHILRELLLLCHAPVIKVTNTEVGCAGMTSFLQGRNIPLQGAQWEMIKEL